MRLALTLAMLSGLRCSAKCTQSQDLGCFNDQTGNTLDGFKQLGVDGTAMDHDICGQLCSNHGFPIAGVEYGHQCMCGKTVQNTSAAKPHSACNMPCTAAPSEWCGGDFLINIYRYTCVGPPTPVPPPAPPPPPPPAPPNLCPDYSREYCKPGAATLEERIEMVLGHMSVYDKMATMAERSITGTYTDGTPLVARSVSWWNEALHGVCRGCETKCATQFPEANAMGNSFNATLWHAIGEAISSEGRAFYNVGGLNGLTFFAPQINLASNPLWGRAMECPGASVEIRNPLSNREAARGHGWVAPPLE